VHPGSITEFSSLQGKKYSCCEVHLTILRDTVALQRGAGSCSLCSASHSSGPLLQRLQYRPVLALWQHVGCSHFVGDVGHTARGHPGPNAVPL